jgi:hypothetical protein
MTQYNDVVELQKEILDKEQADKSVTSIDTRYENGKWIQQTIFYASGKKVTEFRDTRKKTIEEYYGEN